MTWGPTAPGGIAAPGDDIPADDRSFTVADIAVCFEGAVPAVIATASADGTPNVTYLSRVHAVDAERVALSNQFFSKTVANLAENPRASLLIVDPTTYDQYRLTLAYERTERRGPVFERLRTDIDVLAALEGMPDVFKLRAADIYRVLHIEPTPNARRRPARPAASTTSGSPPQVLAELAARLSRAADLDVLVAGAVQGLVDLLGYESAAVLLLDESGRQLFTIASRGYPDEGVGSEIELGDGAIGLAAERCRPVRVGNLRQLSKYSRTLRRSFDAQQAQGPGPEIPVPDLPDAQSQVAVPALALGQLVGVVTVESSQPVAFSEADEAVLQVVATVVAAAVEAAKSQERLAAPAPPAVPAPAPAPAPPATATRVRFYEVDGSTFIDGDYLIKGVAGRLLWALLGHHQREGRVDFTNREMRLDPSLDLPAYRDNFESRLILLKRRLDERSAPVRIEKTGRGGFRLLVEGPIALERG
ncbi:MAG: GAF domain-containing protein [Acidimicrobiia bacterium]